MTTAEAKILLSYHSGRNGDFTHEKWTNGFLGSLRPYGGALIEENFHEVIACLRALGPELRSADAIDRQVTADIFGIVHLSRMWSSPEGMLGRNRLITDRDRKRLESWADAISYAFMAILDGCDDKEAFAEYEHCIATWNEPMNLAFFASHGGSNMQAIIDATKSGVLNSRPALLISNNRNSQATVRAQQEGMPFRVINDATHPDPEARDFAMLHALREHSVDLVILAGYMKKIGPRVLEAYRDRILNIHPSLLPKFGGQGMFGKHVHRAVLEAGETLTGVSIHLVNDEYDQGRILARAEVPVQPDDTVETLAARVPKREHEFFVETLGKIALGQLLL